MLAIELVQAGDSNAPNAELARDVLVRARRGGLLLLTCGVHRNVLRLLVPLVATDDQLDRSLAILSETFAAATHASGEAHA